MKTFNQKAEEFGAKLFATAVTIAFFALLTAVVILVS